MRPHLNISVLVICDLVTTKVGESTTFDDFCHNMLLCTETFSYYKNVDCDRFIHTDLFGEALVFVSSLMCALHFYNFDHFWLELVLQFV